MDRRWEMADQPYGAPRQRCVVTAGTNIRHLDKQGTWNRELIYQLQ